MSTPSPVPLDNHDGVSPYAPKWAHQPTADAQPIADARPDSRRPSGIETENDARILDEIELSLRAMIAANLGGDEPERLSDVSLRAAERLAQEPPPAEPAELHRRSEGHADDARSDAADFGAEARPGESPQDQIGADMATVRAAIRDPRTPPWLLSRSLQPEPVPEPEPWPPRKRNRSNKMFVRFGLAAVGAAVVAAIAVKDIPSLIANHIRGPIESLSTNAVAVFNEGKAPPLQGRMEAAQKELERAAESGGRAALASVDPKVSAVPVKTETIARAPEAPREPAPRETVGTPWPAPEAAKRSEPAAWQSPPAAVAARPEPQPREAPATQAPPTRKLSDEEIAMLRKMGDDYISNGDFVGARAVLERAADAGDASAAFAIASTYDPVVLERFKVRGLEPDIVKASFWYERARALGSSEAPHRLQAMMAARAN